MVTVVSIKVSENNETKEEFYSLVVQGDIELVQSKQTGRMYATARECIISSTFTEQVALQMVGQTMPGNVEKVECEEYDWVNPDSGEIIRLSHRYEYVAEGAKVTKPQSQQQSSSRVEADVNTFSKNGTRELVEA